MIKSNKATLKDYVVLTLQGLGVHSSLKDLGINSEMLSSSMAKYLASGIYFDDLGTDLISLRRLEAMGIYNLQLKLKS